MTALECDLAVVGGGVAGMYCAMHSARDRRVALFEGSHCFGGKLETVSMLGFDAEYGVMRFDPIRQFRIGELIDERTSKPCLSRNIQVRRPSKAA